MLKLKLTLTLTWTHTLNPKSNRVLWYLVHPKIVQLCIMNKKHSYQKWSLD